MATYNGSKYISEQFDSLLKQTYSNWKIIVHDDNSQDNTVEIIKIYEKKHPNKIKLIDDNINPGGAKENFSYLLGKIDENYHYLMFCDQDDVWLEDKIELTLGEMKAVEKNKKDIPILVHTDLKVVDYKLNTIYESMFKSQKLDYRIGDNLQHIAIENVVTGCTIMINKIRNAIFKLQIKNYSDQL